MLAFLAALTLTLAGVGWYLDWYRIRSSPAPSGQRSVTVDINTEKIGKDLLDAEKRIQQRLAEKAKAESEGAKPEKKSVDLPPPPANVSIFED
jgi:hypothetical protein